MKNNKGQALVEFILIFPLLIMILMAMIDIGNITIHKYKLENKLNTISKLYNGNKQSDIDRELDDNMNFYIYHEDEYTSINLSEEVKVITPILNNIIGNPYIITTTKYIYED